MEMTEEQYLAHYGILRRSGRYPWGSGGPEHNTGPRSFMDTVNNLRKQGLSDPEIAEGMGIESSTKLRQVYSLARSEHIAGETAQMQRLRDKGVAYTEIGKRMGIPEATVRSRLAPGAADRVDITKATSNFLKDHVDKEGPVDIGTGVENWIGVNSNRLKTAVAGLEEQGYVVQYIKQPQLGMPGKFTSRMVLTPPGMDYQTLLKTPISTIHGFTDDGGRSYVTDLKPLPFSSERLGINYSQKNAKGEEIGGGLEDGVIHVRPGVPDVSLGSARYAQVRIQVDDTHYIKGMAVYKEDLPDGVDLVFNTNKTNTGNKLDALKPLKNDPANPFGSSVKPAERDKHGNATSVMNKVYEEGDWERWTKALSSQFLSKQSHQLARTQLNLTHEDRKNTLNEILALTNPTVRQHLLNKFADETDSAAVHLKAAAMPRQSSHVILPMNSLKENEIYAPAFKNGDRVVLIRHPHGGPFEIPELVVNNRHPEGVRTLGDVQDAVAIHSKVAEKLSGADFDGDTVLVIPNHGNRILSKPSLEGLKNFDHKREFPPYDGMKTIDGGTYNAKTGKVDFPEGKKPSGKGKQVAMGDISNLITDMTIKGASPRELAQAVRHSMVVIDAEKHVLNWRESARANGIPALKAKYQGRDDKGRLKGASTLISRSNSEQRVPERKQGFRVDPQTGEKIYRYTDAGYYDAKGKWIVKTTMSTKGAEAKSAHDLVGNPPTKMESLYADHSDRLRNMANQARLASVNTKGMPKNPSAAKAYSEEVAQLHADLEIALKNRPLERHAQALANAQVEAKKIANPDMDKQELKKVQTQALTEARARTGANKKLKRVPISDAQWQAIQAGAISPSKLKQILDNTDLDRIRELATPKTPIMMTTTRKSRAQAMLNSGFTQQEVAEQLGVSLSTLRRSMSEGT